MAMTTRLLKTFEIGDPENPSKRKETYILSFVMGKETFSAQVKSWSTAKFVVEAIDEKIRQDGYSRLSVVRYRKPSTATTMYTYRYERRN